MHRPTALLSWGGCLPADWGAEAHGALCTPAGHGEEVVLAMLLGPRAGDSWGQAVHPPINADSQGPGAAASLGHGVCSPPGRCPPGGAGQGLFLGLAQADGGCSGTRQPSGRNCRFPPQVSRGGGHPPGHAAPPVQHPTTPPPCTHPMHRGATRQPWVPLKASPSAGSFCKARKWENDERGEVLVAPALTSLALPPAKTLPKGLPTGPHPDPEQGMLSPNRCPAQPAQLGLRGAVAGMAGGYGCSGKHW